MQLQPRGAQRWPPIVGERAPHRQAIPADGLRLVVLPVLERALAGPHPAHLLLEPRLRVPIGLEDRFRRLAQVVELAQLVGHAGQHQRHRRADRLLPVGDDAADRHRQRRLDLAQQRREVALRPAQEAARQQDLPREAVAQHPQHLVPDVGLQAIERQDDLLLVAQALAQAPLVAQPERDEFLIALDQMRHRALGDREPAGQQLLMDLGHAAVLGEAQRADQGDDVQAELAVRQRPAALLLGPVGPPVQRAGRLLALAHHQRQPIQAVEGGDGAPAVVGDVGGAAAVRATRPIRLQPILPGRRGTGLAAGHAAPPPSRRCHQGAQSSRSPPGLLT